MAQVLLLLLLQVLFQLDHLAVRLHAVGALLVDQDALLPSAVVVLVDVLFEVVGMFSIVLLRRPPEGLVHAVLLLDLLDQLGLELTSLLRQVVDLLHVLLNLELRLVVLVLQGQVIDLDSADLRLLVHDFLFVFVFQLLDGLLNGVILLLQELRFLLQLSSKELLVVECGLEDSFLSLHGVDAFLLQRNLSLHALDLLLILLGLPFHLLLHFAELLPKQF